MNGASSPRAGRQTGTDDLAFSAALLVVALLPRLFVAIAWSKEPVWDGHYYHFGAERIAAGLGYSEDVWSQGKLVWKPWVHYPVGYSALLGIVYWIFGSGLLIAPLLNALAGTALAVVVHRFSRYFLGTTRARIAGALVALHPGLIAYSALVMTEIVAALLLTAAGLVLLAYRARSRLGGLVGAGVLLGVAALVRPTSLLAIPLVLFVAPGAFWARVRSMLVVSACTVAVVLPWTVRNCTTLDGCALISTNGGWNLAIGAITQTGRFETLRASDGCRVVTGQVQQDRCWAQVGVQKIFADPLAWIARAPKKLAETFNHESFAVEYLHEADPVSWTDERRAAGRELMTTAHRLLMVAAALGVVGLPTRRRENGRAFALQFALLGAVLAMATYAFWSDSHPFYWFALFASLVGVLPLPGRPALGSAGAYALGLLFGAVVTHTLFFGEDRYHVVVAPMLCALAAAALRPAAAVRPSG